MTNEKIEKLINESEKDLEHLFINIEKNALINQKKVLDAFKTNNIALRHFNATTGYGYGDEGREALKKVYSNVFNCEASIVSPNIVSGTHALSLCLFGILRPDDLFLSVTGKPYDTLIDVIEGINIGSLKDFKIKFEYLNLLDGKIDYKILLEKINKLKPKMIYLQRSRGYEWRDALTVSEIKRLCLFLRKNNFNGCIMVDNCYGEFIEEIEPTDVGADIIAGSLIKNIGGGLAQTGGYIAGKSNYINLIENRLTAPSIGGEVGSYAFTYQYLFQGLFLAPHIVMQALKSSLLFGAVFNKLGYNSSPDIDKIPGDIIRAIKFNNKEKLISFINKIQQNSPVDSFVSVEPWDMPGYNHQVIMAAGCFVQGSSIELSADAPIKEPYIAYLQGSLTYEHSKIALSEILKTY